MSNISHPNYMDKVPLKISEKFTPPPEISLPQNIYERWITKALSSPSNDENNYDFKKLDYDFSLERNVLTKIQEWKKVRDIERENRHERIRQYEINCLREMEEKQKQLLTAVSYPSTDDLSSPSETSLSSSSDEDNTKISENLNNSTASSNGIKPNKVHSIETSNIQQLSPSHQNFNTILTPTIVPDALNRIDYSNKNNSKLNTSKINYSDFENDTSSPFDNIELKTINDLDILAQVLNITQKHSDNKDSISPTTKETVLTTVTDDIVSANDNNTASIAVTTNVSPITTENNSQNVIKTNFINNYGYSNSIEKCSNNIVYSNQIHGGGGGGANSNNVQQIDATNFNVNSFYPAPPTVTSTIASNIVYTPATGNYNITTSINEAATATTGRINDFYFYNNMSNNQNNYNVYNNYPVNSEQNFLNHKNFYLNHHQLQQQEQQRQQEQILPNATNYDNLNFHNQSLYNKEVILNENHHSNCNSYNNTVAAVGGVGCYSNKSKSVPDILKELNDEIRDSKIRRYQDLESYENKYSKKIEITSCDFNESFMKLSPSSQVLAKNISSMGFPLERVCKIAEKFGNDDKKIFEHLIPLSELLDLGFEESKISEALMKFNNNKEKALDFLIS